MQQLPLMAHTQCWQPAVCVLVCWSVGLCSTALLVYLWCAGWLLRMVCDTRLREEFETLHQAVLELVKVCHVYFGSPGVSVAFGLLSV